MYVRRIAGGVEVLAPAKINLFLEVLARRDDGFHEIETLMVPVRLFDTLRFLNDETGDLNLRCQWASGLGKQASPQRFTQSSIWERLPEGNDNVAMQAVELLRRRTGIQAGATLELTKRIPSAAGLGGGSSDAAAALIAANLVWDLGWSADQLSHLAAGIGSDVPFFLGADPALCTGRGERVHRLAGLGSLDLVVACPPEGLSTAQVYANCQPAERPREVGRLINALRSGDRRKLAEGMFNRLEGPAARLSRRIARLANEFAAVGCIAAQMSGSGSSYFGVCHHAGHARWTARRLRRNGYDRVYAVRSM